MDAIELLGSQNSTENDQSEDNIAMAQNCESRASLQLYLGQFSCSDDALESFRVGVKELERAVGILEQLCETGTIQNAMDAEGSGVEMSLVDLKRFLVETR